MSLFPVQSVTTDFAALNKLIYGFPKTGKTTLAAHMADSSGKPPLFIATEEGHGALSVHRVRITSWDGAVRLVKLLKSKADQVRQEHSCFVIDLISDLELMAQRHICAQKSVEYVGDLDYGKGWMLLKEAFSALVTELMAILPVVFITHSAEKEIMWNNEKIKVQTPTLSKGCLEFINGKVDCIMWIAPGNSKTAPAVVIENSTTCIAGSRYPQIVKTYPLDIANAGNTFNVIAKDFANGAQANKNVTPITAQAKKA